MDTPPQPSRSSGCAWAVVGFVIGVFATVSVVNAVFEEGWGHRSRIQSPLLFHDLNAQRISLTPTQLSELEFVELGGEWIIRVPADAIPASLGDIELAELKDSKYGHSFRDAFWSDLIPAEWKAEVKPENFEYRISREFSLDEDGDGKSFFVAYDKAHLRLYIYFYFNF